MAVDEITRFLEDNDMMVYLVVFGHTEFLTGTKLFRDVQEGEQPEEDDVALDEFKDAIDPWIIDELKQNGLTTARQVLGTSRDYLIKNIDLEEETVDEIIRVLASEFDEEETAE